VTHQRVAESFRNGRVLLAGDAAHVNNPIGGMGLNGGIQDAVNLVDKLIRIVLDAAPERLLDLYDLQRRSVAIEFVQTNCAGPRPNPNARGNFSCAHR
jgi:3-(3-hydroxy-phenyl)propionate hydroxylase